MLRLLFIAFLVAMTVGLVLRTYGPSWRWYRRCVGGHWELIDFDLLESPFDGCRWIRVEPCSLRTLQRSILDPPRALVLCEHGRWRVTRAVYAAHMFGRFRAGKIGEGDLADYLGTHRVEARRLYLRYCEQRGFAP